MPNTTSTAHQHGVADLYATPLYHSFRALVLSLSDEGLFLLEEVLQEEMDRRGGGGCAPETATLTPAATASSPFHHTNSNRSREEEHIAKATEAVGSHKNTNEESEKKGQHHLDPTQNLEEAEAEKEDAEADSEANSMKPQLGVDAVGEEEEAATADADEVDCTNHDDAANENIPLNTTDNEPTVEGEETVGVAGDDDDKAPPSSEVLGNENMMNADAVDATPPAAVEATQEQQQEAEEEAFALPPLLDANKKDTIASSIRGPTPYTNWVVDGLVMQGPLPRASNPREFSALVGLRFNLFVSLAEDSAAPANYIAEYASACRAAVAAGRGGGGSDDDTFAPAAVALPLVDGRPLKKEDGHYAPFMRLVERVASSIRSGVWIPEAGDIGGAGVKAEGAVVGEGGVPPRPHRPFRVYVHCLKGHGRSGMFSAALLATLYGPNALHPMKAVNLVNRLHECRLDDEGYCSPESQDQRQSVMLMLLEHQSSSQQ